MRIFRCKWEFWVERLVAIFLFAGFGYLAVNVVMAVSAVPHCSERAPAKAYRDVMDLDGFRSVQWPRGYYAVLRDGNEIFRATVKCGGDGLTYRLSADGNIGVNFKALSYFISLVEVPSEAMAILKAGRNFFSPDPKTGDVTAEKFDQRCRINEPMHRFVDSGFVSWQAGSYRRSFQSITVWVAPECGGNGLDYRFDRATKTFVVARPETGWSREVHHQDLPAMVLKIVAAGSKYF